MAVIMTAFFFTLKKSGYFKPDLFIKSLFYYLWFNSLKTKSETFTAP